MAEAPPVLAIPSNVGTPMSHAMSSVRSGGFSSGPSTLTSSSSRQSVLRFGALRVECGTPGSSSQQDGTSRSGATTATPQTHTLTTGESPEHAAKRPPALTVVTEDELSPMTQQQLSRRYAASAAASAAASPPGAGQQYHARYWHHPPMASVRGHSRKLSFPFATSASDLTQQHRTNTPALRASRRSSANTHDNDHDAAAEAELNFVQSAAGTPRVSVYSSSAAHPLLTHAHPLSPEPHGDGRPPRAGGELRHARTASALSAVASFADPNDTAGGSPPHAAVDDDRGRETATPMTIHVGPLVAPDDEESSARSHTTTGQTPFTRNGTPGYGHTLPPTPQSSSVPPSVARPVHIGRGSSAAVTLHQRASDGLLVAVKTLRSDRELTSSRDAPGGMSAVKREVMFAERFHKWRRKKHRELQRQAHFELAASNADNTDANGSSGDSDAPLRPKLAVVISGEDMAAMVGDEAADAGVDSHPSEIDGGIVAVYGVAKEETGSTVRILMEFMDAGHVGLLAQRRRPSFARPALPAMPGAALSENGSFATFTPRRLSAATTTDTAGRKMSLSSAPTMHATPAGGPARVPLVASDGGTEAAHAPLPQPPSLSASFRVAEPPSPMSPMVAATATASGAVATLPLAVLRAIGRQLLRGLCTLHEELRVIHRDLKPHNVLVNSAGAVKLADFGVAAILPRGVEHAEDQQGSVLQMSPERLRGERHSYPSDVWAFGVTLAELALGQHPFQGAVAMKTTEGRFWELLGALDAAPGSPRCPSTKPAADDTKRDEGNRSADFDPIADASHGRSLPLPLDPPPLVMEMLRAVESRAGAPIADAIRQCLHDNPAARPTARELLQRYPAFAENSATACDDDQTVVRNFLVHSGLAGGIDP